IHHRRRSPDRPARFVFPNQFTLVRRQAVQVMVTGSDVQATLYHDRAGPDALVLAGRAETGAVGNKVPNQLASLLLIATDHPVFGRGVNETVDDRRCRIRVNTYSRLPDRLAVGWV